MKHVARRHFFVRECVENHLIRVPFVRTDENDADFFTKVLPARKFFPLRDKIMECADSPTLGRGARRSLARFVVCHGACRLDPRSITGGR